MLIPKLPTTKHNLIGLLSLQFVCNLGNYSAVECQSVTFHDRVHEWYLLWSHIRHVFCMGCVYGYLKHVYVLVHTSGSNSMSLPYIYSSYVRKLNLSLAYSTLLCKACVNYYTSFN